MRLFFITSDSTQTPHMVQSNHKNVVMKIKTVVNLGERGKGDFFLMLAYKINFIMTFLYIYRTLISFSPHYLLLNPLVFLNTVTPYCTLFLSSHLPNPEGSMVFPHFLSSA